MVYFAGNVRAADAKSRTFDYLGGLDGPQESSPNMAGAVDLDLCAAHSGNSRRRLGRRKDAALLPVGFLRGPAGLTRGLHAERRQPVPELQPLADPDRRRPQQGTDGAGNRREAGRTGIHRHVHRRAPALCHLDDRIGPAGHGHGPGRSHGPGHAPGGDRADRHSAGPAAARRPAPRPGARRYALLHAAGDAQHQPDGTAAGRRRRAAARDLPRDTDRRGRADRPAAAQGSVGAPGLLGTLSGLGVP